MTSPRDRYPPSSDARDGSRLTLREVTDIVLSLKEAGISPQAIAEAMGETREWVEALLALARDPVARTLVNTERLQSVQAWAAFSGLSPELRRRILDSDEAISEWQCLRLRQSHSAVGKSA